MSIVANARFNHFAGSVIAATLVTFVSAKAQAEAEERTEAPVLEEIKVTADRKDSYGADLVQAGSFRGARQMDTPLTINVIPNTLIETQQAQGLVDPAGIRVLGARIVGVLNLALVSVPIPLVLDNCVFVEPINLGGTEIPYLELDGSYTREIHASGLHVRNNLSMGKGFHAVGGIFLDHAKIGLDLDFGATDLGVSPVRVPVLDLPPVPFGLYLPRKPECLSEAALYLLDLLKAQGRRDNAARPPSASDTAAQPESEPISV